MALSRRTHPRNQPRKTKADLTPIHAKRAAEFWSEIFVEALVVYAGDEGQIPPEVAAQRARALADAALDQFESRWAGVRI
jgi:hypothetical protein